MAAKIKKGDTVVVIAGKDKGRAGKVIKVYPDADRVTVEGINVVARAMRPSMSSPEGGLKRFEAPVHLSNVAIQDPKTGKPTRVGFKTTADGRKVRVAKGSGVDIDV
jgi:large subunit ribosomal protein L24